MGNQQYQESRSQSRYTKWDSSGLQRISGISSNQLPQLQQTFLRAAGPDGLINRNEFGRIYRELNIGSNDEGSIDRAFRAFDTDHSGQLSFDEFLSATVMLNNKTNTRDRVSYLIDSHNPAGVNHTFITPDYGRQIVRNMNQFYGTNANFDDVWSKLNANNGQVHREVFVSYISETPTFAQHF